MTHASLKTVAKLPGVVKLTARGQGAYPVTAADLPLRMRVVTR